MSLKCAFLFFWYHANKTRATGNDFVPPTILTKGKNLTTLPIEICFLPNCRKIRFVMLRQSLFLSLTHTSTHSHTYELSLCFTHTDTHTHMNYISLSHTHTHKHTLFVLDQIILHQKIKIWIVLCSLSQDYGGDTLE